MQTLVLCVLIGAFLIGIWRLVIDGIHKSTWNYRCHVNLAFSSTHPKGGADEGVSTSSFGAVVTCCSSNSKCNALLSAAAL